MTGGPALGAMLNGLRVVLIDDSRSFLARVKEIIEHQRCIVLAFTDAREAMKAIPSFDADIIITDYEMPDLTGLQVIHELRKNSDLKAVPILMLTSRDDTESLVEATLAGADALIVKSEVRQKLLPSLLALTRLRSLQKEVVRLKQFSAIKAMMSTYKHEFGNVLAILDGKVKKL